MSFDTAIAELTSALNANTEQLKLVNAGRDAAIAVAQTVGASKPAATAKKAAEPKPEPEPKADDFAGEEGFARMKAVAGAYIGVSDKTEQQSRAATLSKAMGKLDATKLGEVAEKDRPTLVGWINTLSKGENVPELADEPETGGGLLD